MVATYTNGLFAHLDDPRQARERDRRIALRESELASVEVLDRSTASVLTRVRSALHLDSSPHDSTSCED